MLFLLFSLLFLAFALHIAKTKKRENGKSKDEITSQETVHHRLVCAYNHEDDSQTEEY